MKANGVGWWGTAFTLFGFLGCGGGGGSSSAPLPALTSLEISPASDTLAAGQTRQFSLTGHYSDGSTKDLTTDATWSSSDPAVASVGNGAPSAGRVVALVAGDALVRSAFAPLQAESALRVTPPIATQVTVTPDALQLPLAVEQPLVATATFTDGSVQDVTTQCAWASSDALVVDVGTSAADAGLLRSRAEGAADVTATLDGQVGTAIVAVLPIDVLQADVPSSAGLSTPTVAPAAGGALDAAWFHSGANPDELYLAHFDPLAGWSAPEIYDTSSLADRIFGARIASSATGDTLLAWVGHAGLYAASRPAGGSFSPPVVLASGTSPFLAFVNGAILRMDDAGRGLLVWEDDNPKNLFSAQFLPQAGWSSPVTVLTAPQFTALGNVRMDMNENGAAFLLIRQGSVTSSWKLLAARFDPLSGWEPAEVLVDQPTPEPFDVAVNASGAALATWTDSTSFFPTTILYSARYVPGLGWQTAEPIADQNRPADPQVALASNGDALVHWRNAFDADVAANRYVAGVGWQGVEILAHEPTFQGDAAPLPPFVNDAGDFVASWIRFSVPRRVEYRHFHASTGWGPRKRLDFLEFSGSVGSLDLVTDKTGRSILTWTVSQLSDLNSAYAHRFQVP